MSELKVPLLFWFCKNTESAIPWVVTSGDVYMDREVAKARDLINKDPDAAAQYPIIPDDGIEFDPHDIKLVKKDVNDRSLNGSGSCCQKI